MTDAQPVIRIRDLAFAYDGRPVLQGVNLDVAPGEFLGFIGPNGGGKTTLMKLVLGLLKPGRGEISVFGTTPHQAVSRIGYVPQHLSVRPDFPITVLDIVLMGLLRARERGWRPPAGDRERASKALARVDLADVAGKKIDQLSGGQKQRVLIARALVSDPDLLILDEPTSNIDPQGRFCFFQFLEDLRRDITICIVSHDMSVLASRLTGLVCVNRRLIHNTRPELTADMITLLYGSHDPHSCPAGAYFQGRSGQLPEAKSWLS